MQRGPAPHKASLVARHLMALLVVGATLAVVGVIERSFGDPPNAVLLYLIPIILAASRWGRGPALTAAIASLLGHDLLYVEPVGTLTIARADEALGLALLLFTALVTSQLADSARRGMEAAQEAAVVRRSDQLKTALLRAVSHHLRTPLASIKASVSGLRQTEADYTDEDRAELLAAIEEETDRLDRLVGNLLDASRLEAGTLLPSKRPHDLAELIPAVVARLRPLLAGRETLVEVPEGLPSVPCEYAQIDQVVANLVENSAIHTPARTPVTIRASVDGNDIRVEVLDRGPGVARDQHERLFRPFERGRTSARGTGLGLAIARGFVEAHGGRLWVEEPPGGGASFIFTLPLYESAR